MKIFSVFISFDGEFYLAPLPPIGDPFFYEALENLDEKLS
jgi:hypothetical protein